VSVALYTVPLLPPMISLALPLKGHWLTRLVVGTCEKENEHITTKITKAILFIGISI
jgi:hypothetical protein